MKHMDTLLHAMPVLMPNRLKIWFYNKFLGHEISPSASIGFSYIQAHKIKVGPQARIGHFNIFRNLDILSLGQDSSVGSFNKASAIPSNKKTHFSTETDRVPALIIGKHSGVVNGNFFDCNNTISIGNFTLIAGFGSDFFTHGIDVKECRQISAPIRIGDHCMIATRCLVTKGATLPDSSVLGAGSLLHKAQHESYKLYSGVPAAAVKDLDPASEYFSRRRRYIS